jgi:hypothetical protein
LGASHATAGLAEASCGGALRLEARTSEGCASARPACGGAGAGSLTERSVFERAFRGSHAFATSPTRGFGTTSLRQADLGASTARTQPTNLAWRVRIARTKLRAPQIQRRRRDGRFS